MAHAGVLNEHAYYDAVIEVISRSHKGEAELIQITVAPVLVGSLGQDASHSAPSLLTRARHRSSRQRQPRHLLRPARRAAACGRDHGLQLGRRTVLATHRRTCDDAEASLRRTATSTETDCGCRRRHRPRGPRRCAR